jgi:hypothetical protein
VEAAWSLFVATRYGLISVSVRANPVAVRVVATAAAVIGPRRRSADSSSADRRRTDTVAPVPAAITVTPITVTSIASGYSPAPHGDSAATPRSSNCDSAAAVGSATAPKAATSATASVGIVWDQASGEQNECSKSSKNITEHQRNLPTKSASPAKLRRSQRGTLM